MSRLVRLLLLSSLISLSAMPLWSADITPATCSRTDVQAAIDSASEGDRVLVPAGSCTWTSTVVLPDSPSMTLQGAGTDQTFITCNTGGGCLALNLASSRITGFRLTISSGNNIIPVNMKADQWRIDHNRIDSPTFIVGILVQNSGAISTSLPRGLIDNNEFLNARVLVNGDLSGEVAGNGLWAQDLALGTDKAVYIEDNAFVCDVFCNVVDGNRGGAYVFRYNTVDGGYVEAHGALSARGHMKWEIYENYFEHISADPVHFLFLRAGTGVVFNNVADPTTLSDAKIRMDNRRSFETFECDGTNPWDSNEEANGWLCRDQIQASTDAFLWTAVSGIPSQAKVPAYFWNNKIGVGGSDIPVVVTTGSVDWIIEDRDFFVDGAKPGYTAFTYPHPLQTTTDPIDASRKITWNPGIAGGIPNRTTICDTLNPGATAAQINTAIAGCASGEVVFLSAGTYNLTAGIVFNDKSNVTLRGAGPTQTIITFTTKVSCGGFMDPNVCFKNGDVNGPGSPSNTANWTAGYAKDTTVITLSSTINLQVGSLLVLDQLNDTNTDNGEVWVNDNIGVGSIEGGIGSFQRGGNRAQQQVVRVTAINGSNITISPGLYMPNWRSGRSPGAYWSDDTPITLSGIENLTLEHENSNAQFGIAFNGAYNCWVKNVKSVKSDRGHVMYWMAKSNVVRDGYTYGTKNAASVSYGIEYEITSDNLSENNIHEEAAGQLLGGTASTGNVHGYNYMIGDSFSEPVTWQIPAILFHAGGTNFHLSEGNDGYGFSADALHGPSHFITSFRDHWTGRDTGKTLHTQVIDISSFSRYWNLIGSVLGDDAYHNTYESIPPSGTSPYTSIYTLGWAANGGSSSIANDPFAATSSMRWGNYDTVNDAVRWVWDEVPTGISPHTNPIPGDQTLIDSYYLTSRPAWFDTAFGNVPWPPIGPDVTGGDVSGLGGHVNKIPARLCYENTPKTGGILDFDADDCYIIAAAGGSGATVSGSVTFSGTVKIQ